MLSTTLWHVRRTILGVAHKGQLFPLLIGGASGSDSSGFFCLGIIDNRATVGQATAGMVTFGLH